MTNNDNRERKVEKLEQQKNAGRPKGHIREYSDWELAQIIAASRPGLTPEAVLAMTDEELDRIIEEARPNK
jgi:hypothetical protein